MLWLSALTDSLESLRSWRKDNLHALLSSSYLWTTASEHRAARGKLVFNQLCVWLVRASFRCHLRCSLHIVILMLQRIVECGWNPRALPHHVTSRIRDLASSGSWQRKKEVCFSCRNHQRSLCLVVALLSTLHSQLLLPQHLKIFQWPSHGLLFANVYLLMIHRNNF